MIQRNTSRLVFAVALVVGLLTFVTSGQVLQTVNDLLPLAKVFRPGDAAFAQLDAVYMKGTLQKMPSFDAVTQQLLGAKQTVPLAVARDGVQLFAFPGVTENCQTSDLVLCGAVLVGLQVGATPLGAIELAHDFKLGNSSLFKGRYEIAAIYDSENKDATVDPQNKTDLYLVLWRVSSSGGTTVTEAVGYVGFSMDAARPVTLAVFLAAGTGPLVGVMLNVVAALLRASM